MNYCAKCGADISVKRKLCNNCLSPGSKAARHPTNIAKASKSKLGKKLSPEHIERLRVSNTGRKHSDETKLKLSEIAKRRKPTLETRRKISKSNTGRKHTEESKVRMSAAQKGKVMSEAAKLKISQARKGKSTGQAWNKGIPQSEETKRKISEAGKGRKWTDEHRAYMSQLMKGNTYTKGYKPTAETKAKVQKLVADGKLGGYTWSKKSKYESKLGFTINCRSSWEHKVAEYLDSLSLVWSYESEIIIIEDDSYLPDFLIYNEGKLTKIIEVKGWFPENEQLKMAKFKSELIKRNVELEIWDEAKLRELKLL